MENQGSQGERRNQIKVLSKTLLNNNNHYILHPKKE